MDDSITLREGLEKFYRSYDGHLSHEKEGISDEARAFFKSHDVAHVLFGCDISLFGEGAVKIWTIFGTTLGFWKHLTGYSNANAFQLARKGFTFMEIARHIFKLLGSIPLLIFRARKMSKRWPWANYDAYLDKPLSEIRKEYNIRVVS